MAQVSILNAATDISGSLTYPAISAGSNRKALLIVANGLTGATVTIPTAVTIGGQTATYEAGATTTGQRTSIVMYSITDAQISAMSGSAVVITGGNTQRRIVSALTIQNTEQTITNTNGYYDSGTSNTTGSPISLVRSANSFTVSMVKLMLLTAATLGDPSRLFDYYTASSCLSLGYANDTARTANATFSFSSGLASELAVNFKEAIDGIVDVNGGSAVKNGATFNSTVAGFATVTSGNIAGKSLSGISLSTNTVTATAPNFVDGQTFYEPDTNQTISLIGTATDGGGAKTGTKSIPTASPAGMASVVIASPITADSTYIGSKYTLVNNDRWVFPTLGGDFSVAADGGITALNAGTYVCWHWRASDSMMTQVTLIVNDAGQIISAGLTSSALTSIGLTSSGLTSRSL